MTTITVDEDCLRNVEKLQSLLKLQGSSISGESITRGAAVNFAVSQQLSNMVPSATYAGSSMYQSSSAINLTPSFTTFGGQLSPTITSNECHREYTADFGARKIRTRKGGDKDASGMGTD